MGALALSAPVFSRYVAPAAEELLKSLYVVYLLRRKRVGFLVDAAIQGFAVGAGFALVENAFYLSKLGGASALLWIVRGFGTALLLVVLPLMMIVVFDRRRKATRDWLGAGFDDDVEFLRTILSGGVGETRVGSYLLSLKSRFPGTVVGDMLCLIRVHLELSLHGKGILIAREAGLDVPVGDEVRANLEELTYLEKAIGPTGLLAIRPLLKDSSRDLWHLYTLKRAPPVREAARRRAG